MLIALTAVYLLFEIGFNARLLDVAGSTAGTREIDGLEIHGRLLSGVGAALLIAGAALRRWHKPPLAVALGLPALPVVFWVQGLLVAHLVAATQPEARREAMYLALIPAAVSQGVVELGSGGGTGRGELGASNLDSPAGKALLAVFPALAFGSDLQPKIGANLREIARGSVEHSVGTAERVYNTTFLPVASQLRRTYDQLYLPGSSRLAAATSPSEGGARTPWTEYQRELARRKIDPYTASDHQRYEVVRYLHARAGIPVPSDFQLHDKGAFERAVAQMEHSPSAPSVADRAAFARKQFADGVSRELGVRSNLPPGLSWRAFATHPDVQRKAKGELRQQLPELPDTCGVALAGAFSDFRAQCYEPLVSRAVNDSLKAYRASGDALAPGGQHAGVAERAVRRVFVPPIALGFSLFFGTLNAVGLLIEALWFRRAPADEAPQRAGWPRYALQVALLAFIVGLPLLLPNPVEQSSFVAGQKSRLQMQGDSLRAHALTWLLRAEPTAYPVANAIRVRALQGYEYAPFRR